MRWIEKQTQVESILNSARECVIVDATDQPGQLERFTFDSVEFVTKRFLRFLKDLMTWSGDRNINYIVLAPDPIVYFHARFHKYPLLEIAIDDSEDGYIQALNADPGGSPADAIGTNWSEYVMLPPSKTWFIRGQRDSRSGEGGHLWIPRSFGTRAKEIYPFDLY